MSGNVHDVVMRFGMKITERGFKKMFDLRGAPVEP